MHIFKVTNMSHTMSLVNVLAIVVFPFPKFQVIEEYMEIIQLPSGSLCRFLV
jgi:hypothetical protein